MRFLIATALFLLFMLHLKQKLTAIPDWDTESFSSVDIGPYMHSNSSITKPVYKGGQLSLSDTGLEADVSCAVLTLTLVLLNKLRCHSHF